MKVKINHTLFITLSLITLLIAGNYWGIAQFVLPYKARLYILVLSGAIPLLLPLYYKKRSIIIPWMLCFFFVLFRNQEFLSGGYYNSIRLIGAYLFIFASVKSCDWIKKAPQLFQCAVSGHSHRWLHQDDCQLAGRYRGTPEY